MPKSKISKKKMFREVSYLDQRYVNHNHLKHLKKRMIETEEANDIYRKELMFLLWAYDLEFFTLDFASREYGMKKKHLSDRIVFPLVRTGWVYKHFDKQTPSQKYEDHLFREETKMNYRVRYALTQKARLMLQRFYNSLSPSDGQR